LQKKVSTWKSRLIARITKKCSK